jgi:hypothetical protein
MAKLGHRERDRLPDRDFAVLNPHARTEKERRKYPIPDESHARNALARVHQKGTPMEKSKVCEAVHRKFPGIHERSCPMRMRA